MIRELESAILGPDAKMTTDEGADCGLINMNEPTLMDVNESELEPIDMVIKIKSFLRTIPCEDEPIAADLEEEVQLNSCITKNR